MADHVPITQYRKPPGSPGDAPERCTACWVIRFDKGRGPYCPTCDEIDRRVQKCRACGAYRRRKAAACPCGAP